MCKLAASSAFLLSRFVGPVFYLLLVFRNQQCYPPFKTRFYRAPILESDFLKDSPTEQLWGKRILRGVVHDILWYGGGRGPCRGHTGKDTDPEGHGGEKRETLEKGIQL